MSLALTQRVKDLEKAVADLERRLKDAEKPVVTLTPSPLAELQKIAEEQKSDLTQKPRAMCPKCKVKPNYFFHVKTCRGNADVA